MAMFAYYRRSFIFKLILDIVRKLTYSDYMGVISPFTLGLERILEFIWPVGVF